MNFAVYLFCFYLPPVAGTSYRLAAVGHRQSVATASNYSTWFNQFNNTNLYRNSSDDTTIIVFGELTGFTSALIGTRGQTARAQSGTIENAFSVLAKSYEKQITAYVNKYSNITLVTALELSLSDVMWRAFNQTFSTLARSLNATIVSSTFGPRIFKSTDRKDIELYGDPDLYPNQTEVYLPLTKEIYNTAHVYAPNGNLIASRDKYHLTPSEMGLLQFTSGKLESNRIIPPNNLCIAICLDAFYLDVLSYLDSQSCTILIQPSFNAEMWATNLPSLVWQPMDWTNGPLGLFQKTQNIRVSINPMITGNLFSDMIVDGQSSINQRLLKTTRPINEIDGLYIGLDSVDVESIKEYITVAMARWAIDDPRERNLTKQERRQLLHQYGLELAPGSKSKNENDYASTIIWADVTL